MATIPEMPLLITCWVFPIREDGISLAISGTVQENEQMLYFSDTWKVTPHVSLTFGTQYNLQHPTYSPQGTMASYNPYTNVLTVDGDAQGQIDMTAQQITQFVYPLFANLIKTTAQEGLPNSLYILHNDLFSPRLGIAWSPRGSWVVRAGYGHQPRLRAGEPHHQRLDYRPAVYRRCVGCV